MRFTSAWGRSTGFIRASKLRVYNPQGKAVGLARVEEAAPTDAVALVTSDQEIKPGFMLSKEV